MLCQKILDHLALVDWVAIPDQDDRTGYSMKNLLKEDDHLFAGETMPVRADTQTNSFAFWRDQQCSQQAQTLVMINGGTLDRRLAPPRPAPFERRNQRKTTFLFQYEGSAQLATLFLSWAVPLSSIARWLPHLGAMVVAAVVGYSSPSAASHARQHWSHSERQRVARSLERSDPESSSLRHTQKHRLLCPALSPVASPASLTISSDDQADEWLFSFWAFWHPLASDPRNAL